MTVQTQVVRVGRRTWIVRTTWAEIGTRRVRIERTERRRIGWPEGQWTERSSRNWPQGSVVSEVWQ